MSDELAPNEERMVNALVRSGVVIEEGKRYTLAEVCAIIDADTYAKVDEDAQLAQHAIGALVGRSRATVAGVLDISHRKIRAALAGMGAA